MSDVLVGSPTHGHTSVGRQSKMYVHQLSVETRCCFADLSRAMTHRDG